ncbi:transposase [Streptomyces coeruleorubidus]|uniref:transposase n=1 Tax=Streptomyces coeruleorubidus TaxID=116188 RepID=UPI0036BCF18F
MGSKSNRSRRYSEEFKRDAAALVRSSGKTVTEVAREIGVSAEGLRNWVKQSLRHGCDSSAGLGGAGDHQHPAQQDDRVSRLLRMDQPVQLVHRSFSFTKKAVAFSGSRSCAAVRGPPCAAA